MTRWLLVLFLSVTPAFAQTQFSAGASAGTQFFEHSGTRFVGGIDGLLEIHRAGLHAAGDFTHDAEGGSVRALHLDATWRNALDERFSLLFGAGLTHVDTEHESDTTWNVEVELARRFGPVDGYVRLRHYDYRLGALHGNPISPTGPSISLGARYRLERRRPRRLARERPAPVPGEAAEDAA